MARIRHIEISNFRGIKHLRWAPSPGINCVIGPGDSGKSTILDAIDLCLSARRNAHFSDADFHTLDVATPLTVSLTLGDLDDELKSMERYGLFLRGFDHQTGEVEDEPEEGGETVLTLQMMVSSDLEPSWTLYSDRAAAQDVTRGLTWGDRVKLAPTRIGALAEINLGWGRGSVLNRLSEERPELSAALAKAARDARIAFGDEVEPLLADALEVVADTAHRLGIPVGEFVKATLSAHDVSFRSGTISLHDEAGVPLGCLGIGSIRLLIAGLQRAAAHLSTVILVDELEHGLEPHRIKRFLDSLGAKDSTNPVQVFATTHSPVVVRELSGHQLYVLRRNGEWHHVRTVGTDDDVQSTVRLYPDAFLAPSILVCEGASEAGLLRGLDQYRADQGMPSLNALGIALVDSGGAEKLYQRASAFAALGYRTAVLRDDDVRPTPELEEAFLDGGGTLFSWRDRRTLEDEVFLSLSDDGVQKLIARAIELHGEEAISVHVTTASNGRFHLSDCARLTPELRGVLGKASRIRRAGWFKSISWMEAVSREIVAPDLDRGDADFTALLDEIFAWVTDGYA